MTSALLLAAYFTMLLSPCVVAEWGDLLTFRWVPAVRLRRRTHPQETWLESLRHERSNLSLAAEADFLHRNERFDTPQPFLVFKHVTPVETPAFLAARQRVAARLAQLAVARKLRDDAAAQDAEDALEAAEEKLVTLPADVRAEDVPATLAAAADIPHFSEYLDALYPEPLPAYDYTPPIYAYQEAGSSIALVTSPPHRERAEVIAINSSRTGSDPWPPGPSGGRPNESSDAVEIAA